MAGMQRFVTYIYAYEEGKRSGNAGYAKIETRGSSGRMEIHFMEAEAAKGNGKISFLFVENEKIFCIPAGEFRIERGGGTYKLLFQMENFLNTTCRFDEMDGICITDSNSRKYLSFWKEVEVSKISEEMFVSYETEEAEPEPVNPIKEPEGHLSQYVKETERKPSQSVKEEDQKCSQSIEEAEQESLHTMEIPMKNIFPNYSLTEVWEQFQKQRDCIKLKENTCAVQIELRDLRELPKKYWYLGNNSFLLHGFFNYRYLLFGKMDENNWFLGVPGVYQKQERVMASVFGFPEFLTFSENEISELQPGVWYHFLED